MFRSAHEVGHAFPDGRRVGPFGRVLAGDDGGDLPHDVGVAGGDIGGLALVLLEIVELPGHACAGFDGLPVAPADSLLHGVAVGAGGFPIEEVVGLLFRTAEEGRRKGDAIGGGQVSRGAGDFGQGGHEVGEVAHVVGDAAGPDVTGPAGEHGLADAALVEVGLAAAETRGAVEEIDEDILPRPRLWTVVGGEDDEGVVVDAEALEESEEFADLAIESGDHAGELGVGVVGAEVAGPRVRPGELGPEALVGGPRVLGAGKFNVGENIGQVGEERAVRAGLAGDIGHGLVVDLVLRVAPALPALVLRERELLEVTHEEVGVIEVGVDLTVLAEPGVETLADGDAWGVRSAEAPFAEAAGGVARGAQDFGEGDVGVVEVPVEAVVADGGVPGVEAGNQRAACGGADVGAGVEAVEAHALGGELVEVGRTDLSLAVRADMADAEVVGEDEDKVGFVGRGGEGGFQQDQDEEEGAHGFGGIRSGR